MNEMSVNWDQRAEEAVEAAAEEPAAEEAVEAAAEEPAAEAPVFTETYEGERDEFGRRRGRGRCVAPDYTYDGEWAEDAAHGRGALTASTFSYEGTFRDGAFHGRGRWRKADGSRSYEGEFESGEFHGAGKLERRADGAHVVAVAGGERGSRVSRMS